MPIVFIIISIVLMVVYGVMFMRPKYRILAAAIVSASLFFLYLALANLGSEAVNRLSIIMLGITGVGTAALVAGHLIFERGRAGRLTGSRDTTRSSREYTP